MAISERNTVYTNDGNRTVYARESNGTGWFVGIIVALALLAIGYLIFSANSGPSTSIDVNTAPAMETPADPSMAPAPMTEVAPPAQSPAAETTPAQGVAAPAVASDSAAPANPAAVPAQ